MDKRTQNGSMTNRIIGLDFDGGLHIYRNTAIMGELKLPALVVPSGIASERRNRLAAKLNHDCAGSGIRFTVGRNDAADSTIHIGKSNAFDAFGHFLGLAEGIGSGNAFVLLDDFASDDELLAVIHHEAGHILGTLDHGGVGLARVAWVDKYYDYFRVTDEAGYRMYLRKMTTRTFIYKSITFPSDGDINFITEISLSAGENGTEYNYQYASTNADDTPETEYIEEEVVCEIYRRALGLNVGTISISGGSAEGCTAINIGVIGSSFHDSKTVHRGENAGLITGTWNNNYHYYQGSAIGCKVSGGLSVSGNAVARLCEASSITVSGDRYPIVYNSTPDESVWEYFNGLADNCTVTGGDLRVKFGGIARDIIVKSGEAIIGNDWSINAMIFEDQPRYDEAGRAELRNELNEYGYGEANNLIVENGRLLVYYGGKIHNAKVNGRIIADTGTVLTGVITCKSVDIFDVVPQTNITVKLDLHDYANANAIDKSNLDENGNGTVTKYFANYTTRTEVWQDWDVVSVSHGTFDNADGRFDMSEWEYTFSVDIGKCDALALPYIVVDFGGTEKGFDRGTVKFDYPSTSRDVQVNLKSDKKKWQVVYETDNWDEEAYGYPCPYDDVYTGYLAYNPTLHGEVADVLWLENGWNAETEYTVELPTEIMSGTMEEVTVIDTKTGDATLANATVKNSELVIKGGASTGNFTVMAEDKNKQDRECDLELIVVPEEIPVVGKLGAKKYSEMLKKAQKEHITKITDVFPFDVDTELFGMKFALSSMSVTLTVNWSKPSMELKLQGKMDWEIGKGDSKNLTIDLSGDNYISITHEGGAFGWDIVGELKVPDFKIGKFGFSDMYLNVNKGESSFGIGCYVTLPSISYKFGGSISIVDGYLDSMSIGVGNLNVPLGATGLMLQSISGSIEGIATSLDMTFGGDMGFTYGPKISVEWDCDWLGIEDGEYSLLEIDVGAMISTSGEITGQAGISSLGGFITGAGGVTAREGYFSINGNFSMLNGCISIEGELHSCAGGVVISGTGTMSVPRNKIFGLLAGMGLSVNCRADFGARYVVAWEDMEIFGNKFSVGIKCTFDGDVDLLGSSDLLGGDDFGTRGLRTLNVSNTDSNLRGGTQPSASETYTIADYGLSIFQVNFTVSGSWMSLAYGGVEYTQEAIVAGLYGNMQLVSELTSANCITIAVSNAALGDWTINAYGDAEATFGAYTLAGNAPPSVIDSVELGEDGRSAVIHYTLPDLSALDNATISIFRNDGDATDYTGLLLAEFAPADATGTFEYALDDAESKGGDYAFYMMVTSANYAPVYSGISESLTFRTIDPEAPDQIQTVNAEWKSSGTELTWEEPYDDMGVTGYKVRFYAGDEDLAERDVKTPSFIFDNVPNGTYSYQVAAFDAAGNLGAWSAEGSVLVNLAANAIYKNTAITEDIELAEYEGAVNITATAATLTTAENSLVTGSTIGDATIGGIVENTVINGETTLREGAIGYNLTVNGTLMVDGSVEEEEDPFAEEPVEKPVAAVYVTVNGVTVNDGGKLVVGDGGAANDITVNSGGAVVLQDDAEFTDLTLDYGTTLTIIGNGKYLLTDDICTAGTLNTLRTIAGNGHKIIFEQYKQTEEYRGISTDYTRDDVAFVLDIDKLTGRALEIEIDSSVYGFFKIADRAKYFDGTITVTDHVDGSSDKVGFDNYTLVGNALCKLRMFDDGLFLDTIRSEINSPTITVENAENNASGSITIIAVPDEYAGTLTQCTFRYSLNADMSDAVVAASNYNDYYGHEGLQLDKSELIDNATYYVQANVENHYGVKSLWSTPVSFTVVPKLLPAAPTLTVTNATNAQAQSVTLTATAVDPNSTALRQYRFRYADNPEFENAIVINTEQRFINYASIDKSQLVEGQDYYVQAGVMMGIDWSYWSDTVVFNTEAWDYDGITIGPEGDFNNFNLGGKSAKNVTVVDGGYFFGGGRIDGLTIETGGFFRDDNATVTNAVVNDGRYWLDSGTVTDLVVNGGELRLMDGTLNGAVIGVDAKASLSANAPALHGTILVQGAMDIYYGTTPFATDASFVFDLGAHEATKDKMYINYTSPLVGTRTFTVQLDNTPETGDYRLTYTPNLGELYVSLTAADGGNLGVMGIGLNPILYKGLYYSLVDQKGVTYLHVSDNDGPAFIGKVKLSKNGTVYDSSDGLFELTVSSSSECDYVLVDAGGQLHTLTVGDGGKAVVHGDVFGATVENGGRLTLKADSRALVDPVTVKKGGNVTIEGGQADLGAAFHLAGGTITVKGRLQSFEEEGEWGPTRHWFVFDLDQMAAAPSDVMISNYKLLLDCTPSFTVNVATKQANGLYKLMGNAASFTGAISIHYEGDNDWPPYLGVGQETKINGQRYALAIQHNVLTLTVGKDVPYNGEPEEPSIVQTQTWEASGSGGYVVEYSADNFQTAVRVNVTDNALDAFAVPSDDYQWRVRPQDGDKWTTGEALSAEGGDDETPQHIVSNDDGVADVFFTKSCGTWNGGFEARHNGNKNGWQGTDEAVSLAGKNKLADIIEGSEDANVLLMTDAANGDALFVDDIYSALPGDIDEQQARIAKIHEIRAGGGDDIVDLTSQQFAYIGGGVTVRGGMGDDVIWANKGDNWLFGDSGDDRIIGASGNDVIIGGFGNDSLHGGGGDDIFAFVGTFVGDWGHDTVEQLADGKVTLWFEEGSLANWNASTLTYKTNNNNSVKVKGVTAENVTLKFGNDGSETYASLQAALAFDGFSSVNIFEDRNRGMLA